MADRGRVRGPRMAKHWHFIPGASILFGGGAQTALASSLALDGPWTVLRMLGEYVVAPRVAPAALEAGSVGIGIGVVSSDAVAAGAGSLPDPLTSDPDYPWLYWANHDFYYRTTTAEAEHSVVGAIRRSFDVKSMRKLKPRESLVFVVEFAAIVGTVDLQFESAVTRVLVAT